jgi:hypothetical protein
VSRPDQSAQRAGGNLGRAEEDESP